MYSKNLWVLLSVLLIIATGGTWCARTWLNRTPVAASPTNIDFGSVSDGVIVDRAVVLTNRTSRPVRITRIMTSCGCTTVKTPHVINPNGTATVDIRFNSADRVGNAQKLIDITYRSDTREYDILVKLHGNVKQFISAIPIDGVDLGTLDKGHKKSQPIELTRDDGLPLHVAKLIKSPNVSVSSMRASGATMIFMVTAKAPYVAGHYSDAVTVELGDDKRTYVVPVQFSVPSLYRLSQKNVNFGVISDSSTPKQVVSISGPALEGLSIALSPRYLKASVTMDNPQKANLTVRFVGDRFYRTALTAPIYLRTNNAKEPEIVVPVFAVQEANDNKQY